METLILLTLIGLILLALSTSIMFIMLLNSYKYTEKLKKELNSATQSAKYHKEQLENRYLESEEQQNEI